MSYTREHDNSIHPTASQSISFPIWASTIYRKAERTSVRALSGIVRWKISARTWGIQRTHAHIYESRLARYKFVDAWKKKKKGGEKSGHSRKSLVGQWECSRTSCARPYASRALDRSRPYRGNCIAAGECAGGFEISNFQSWFSSFNCWPRSNRITGQEFLFVSLPFPPKICLAVKRIFAVVDRWCISDKKGRFSLNRSII